MAMTTEPATQPRRFHLQRDADISGVSGTGIVADGVVWPDNTVSIRWRGPRPSVVFWESLAHAEHVHGHGGATRFLWLDGEDTIRRCPQHPTALGYEHPECGFHWHGRDGVDIPLRDGEPVCPRCELSRLEGAVTS